MEFGVGGAMGGGGKRYAYDIINTVLFSDMRPPILPPISYPQKGYIFLLNMFRIENKDFPKTFFNFTKKSYMF